jgi:hypothetical protein
VFFSINSSALKNPALVGVYRNEIGMLVKSTGLPSFDVKTEAVKQYNRTRNITTHIQYKPITVKFHDDNLGLVNQVWQNYYTYMFADSETASNGGYGKNATKKATGSAYGINGVESAFFNYITISQMAGGKYVSYKLINPVISSWSHTELDYSKTNVDSENTMAINYEAVVYSSGTISVDSPQGFRTVHYDTGTSPLANTLPTATTGANGGVTSPVTSTLDTNPQNTAQQLNNYLNNQTGQAGAASASQTANAGVGGLQGIAFPSLGTNTSTVASAVKLG